MRKNIIIGIHGLGEKPPEHVLHSWWVQSIQEGAQRWNIGLTDFDVKLVYWPDILHPEPLDPRESDPESPLYLDAPYVPSMQAAPARPHNLKKRIIAFVEEKLSALLLNDDLSINYQSVTDTLVRRYFKDLDAYLPSKEDYDKMWKDLEAGTYFPWFNFKRKRNDIFNGPDSVIEKSRPKEKR